MFSELAPLHSSGSTKEPKSDSFTGSCELLRGQLSAGVKAAWQGHEHIQKKGSTIKLC